jgi:hypothetical protein
MNSQSNTYNQSLPARPEQNRQMLLLALLSKFALVLLLGCAYAGIRLCS